MPNKWFHSKLGAWGEAIVFTMIGGLKYDYHNWGDVVGIKKEPTVQTLVRQPVKEVFENE
jgi:hypothetical protein